MTKMTTAQSYKKDTKHRFQSNDDTNQTPLSSNTRCSSSKRSTNNANDKQSNKSSNGMKTNRILETHINCHLHPPLIHFRYRHYHHPNKILSK